MPSHDEEPGDRAVAITHVPGLRSPPNVSVIVVNYNTAHLLHRMWTALMASKGQLSLEVIIVDNASRDGSVEMLKSDPAFSSAHIISNRVNVGFGRANNQAIHFATGRYVLLLNTDAFVSPDTLPRTIEHLDHHPECGVVGVRLVDENGTVQPGCRSFPTPWNLFLSRSGMSRFVSRASLVDDPDADDLESRRCDWVPGCYLLTRRELIDRIGLFDPRYFLYYEEVDFCRRVRAAGWLTWYLAQTTVVHVGGASATSDATLTAAGRQIPTLQIESEVLYVRKHHGAGGLLAFALLSGVADLVQLARRLAKRPGPVGLKLAMAHVVELASTLTKTRWGSTPTR